MVQKRPDYLLFDENTKALVFGYQQNAIQRMLDYDYVCQRKKPSVGAIVNPTRGGFHKCFWGTKEINLPMYKTIKEALDKHNDIDVMVNFASMRSAFPTTMEALDFKQLKTVAIIAEGVPERRTKMIIAKANDNGVTIIGPATVGGLRAGCFKIGNTAGDLLNIIDAKLHRPGTVAYVSKSGGLSNELNMMIGLNTDGVYEGVALGGDRYPGSLFLEHMLRYEANPDVKMIVLLGEVGGDGEISGACLKDPHHGYHLLPTLLHHHCHELVRLRPPLSQPMADLVGLSIQLLVGQRAIGGNHRRLARSAFHLGGKQGVKQFPRDGGLGGP